MCESDMPVTVTKEVLHHHRGCFHYGNILEHNKKENYIGFSLAVPKGPGQPLKICS